MTRIKTAVLISGSGSNLQALIDAAKDDAFPADIALVISNKEDAYGLTRAAEARIETLTIDHRQYKTRGAFDAALNAALKDAGVELVCLAGFMRVLTAGFVDEWKGRMLNIHPSLLPAFRGIHAAKQAFDYGVRVTGCTVHVVTPDLDDGPILGQSAVPVHDGDTLEMLNARIQQAEHTLYPECVAQYATWLGKYGE